MGTNDKLTEENLMSIINKVMTEEDTTDVNTSEQQVAIDDMVDGMDEMLKDLEQMSMEMDSTDYEALKDVVGIGDEYTEHKGHFYFQVNINCVIIVHQMI